jgi:hypothetical protein
MMVKELPLSSGGVTLIDDDVYEWARRRTWRAGGGDRNQYVVRSGQIGHGLRTRRVVVIYLHRAIMNAPAGVEVDHINRNPLDNRRKNLRFATRTENAQNRSNTVPNSRTGVRGVTQEKRSGRFLAQVFRNRKRIYVGSYLTLEEATAAATAARRAAYTHTAEQGDGGSTTPPPSTPQASSGYRYVYWDARSHTYAAWFSAPTGRVWVGSFRSAEEAASAVALKRGALGLPKAPVRTEKPFEYEGNQK